jgi:serine phosphatase RsbU (regulator of sigma subunit)
MKIGVRLTILFFTIAFLSISVIGYLSYDQAKTSLQKESFNRLTAVREMKATQIEDYFQEIRNQVVTFSENHSVIGAMHEFKDGFDKIDTEIPHSDDAEEELKKYYEEEFLPELNPNVKQIAILEDFWPTDERTKRLQQAYISGNPNPPGDKHFLTSLQDSSSYNTAHEHYHPILRNYLEKFGFYDLFLIDDETGDIVYSVFKEVDFSTSLLEGPFKETNFARTFRAAIASDKKEFISIVDFESYKPSHNKPASFIASPIYDKEERIGVLIFQMPIDKINNIMTSRQEWSKVGLGESGETYIVGHDLTLRNQSRFLIEDRKHYLKMIKEIGVSEDTISMIRNFGSTVGLQKVETEGTLHAQSGETDTRIFPDYRGVSVLSAYKPLEIDGLDWVVLSEIDEAEAFEPVNHLRDSIVLVFIILIILIIVTSLLVARGITKPIKALTKSSKELAGGNLDAKIKVKRADEIGVLALSFKSMRDSIHKLVQDLKDINANLEHKVTERTKELQLQKDLMEEKNIEILDSINYAERLQQAILPPLQKMEEKFEDIFVLYKPKDIVSGDFYWMANKGNKVLIAAVDCTGHGVPGALVSVVGSNGLFRCIKEFGLSKPAEILDQLTDIVMETFEADGTGVKDGMDIALCSIDRESGLVEFAGANNPLWILKGNSTNTEDVIEIKGDKQPVGAYEHRKPFTNHSVQLDKGDALYLFTDGFADQFGGERGKKFKYKPFRELIAKNSNLPMEQQRTSLDFSFEKWRGEFEQVDDICLIGIRI